MTNIYPFMHELKDKWKYLQNYGTFQSGEKQLTCASRIANKNTWNFKQPIKNFNKMETINRIKEGILMMTSTKKI
jgi:hypothetical protein